MKLPYFLILILSVIFLSPTNVVAKISLDVEEEPVSANDINGYEEEKECARQWLLKQFLKDGQLVNSLSLKMMYKDDVWPLLYSPVLAYSTESALVQLNDKGFDEMMNPLRNQIAALQKTPVHAMSQSPLYMPKNKEVLPLLAWNKWNQMEPYNMFAPIKNGRKVVIGCVPLATAIAMSYYQWPDRGNACCYYLFDKNHVATMDFSKCTPQWKSYKGSYQRKDTIDEGARNLSKLLVSIGLSVDATFSNEGTSACMNNVKPTLCNHFGYSGHISYYDIRNKNITEEQIEALLYKELDEGRPCIVSSIRHAFVCDGYSDGFFHYNMGWGGYYNGYYRLKLGNYKNSNKEQPQSLIKGIICGIEPQRNDSSTVREVTMKKAGTLEEMLTDQEKETITKLTIKGRINSDDIKLLRKMAGANDKFSLDGWKGGALQELDLSEAKLRIIGKYMFAKCSSLRSILLPKRVEIVDDYAFKDCTSLVSVILPPLTQSVGMTPFHGCTSLEDVFIPHRAKLRGVVIWGSSPALRSVKRY